MVKNQEQNSVYKNSWTLLTMGNQRAVCERRQLQFPPRYDKRGKVTRSNPSPNSFMQQSERKSSRTRSTRGRSPPAVERLDGFARITSEELAISHFVKNGTSQNACSTRPRVVVGLVESAHSQIVRLMNSRQKGLKRMMTKVQWLFSRRVIGKKENLSPMNVTIDRGNLGRGVIRNWDKIHLNVNHLMHGNWVVYFRT